MSLMRKRKKWYLLAAAQWKCKKDNALLCVWVAAEKKTTKQRCGSLLLSIAVLEMHSLFCFVSQSSLPRPHVHSGRHKKAANNASSLAVKFSPMSNSPDPFNPSSPFCKTPCCGSNNSDNEDPMNCLSSPKPDAHAT